MRQVTILMVLVYIIALGYFTSTQSAYILCRN